MNVKYKIDQGLEIRDKVFSGNIYSELGALMDAVIALNILRKDTSTEEEIAWADAKLSELETLALEVQAILNK